MEKKYIIYDILNREAFAGSDLEGAYFDIEFPRLFDTEVEAENRIKEELEYMPKNIIGRILAIIPVWKT